MRSYEPHAKVAKFAKETAWFGLHYDSPLVALIGPANPLFFAVLAAFA
jgi:hypothetical protein